MTPFKRGDVILVKFPYSDLVRYEKRPALVVEDETVETGLS
jgi:mRNA-degrading endonuclease toxin of MazEF toxin-antitoxin module